MILYSDRAEREEAEPAMRSCWECNSAHEHLKTVNTLHLCFDCGRLWVFDLFLDEVGSAEEMMRICAERYGMKPGGSTASVDTGHRAQVFEVTEGP
jgi:hypothetical protein